MFVSNTRDMSKVTKDNYLVIPFKICNGIITFVFNKNNTKCDIC